MVIISPDWEDANKIKCYFSGRTTPPPPPLRGGGGGVNTLNLYGYFFRVCPSPQTLLEWNGPNHQGMFNIHNLYLAYIYSLVLYFPSFMYNIDGLRMPSGSTISSFTVQYTIRGSSQTPRQVKYSKCIYILC